MSTLATLAEAASYLGVSKATLRNWDKEGKLKAHRHPINRYRAYDLEELRSLRQQISLFDECDEHERSSYRSEITQITDQRNVKRIVSRLHAALRDTDGNSSIIQRFDELTKLLFLKLIAEREDESLYTPKPKESISEYANRIRKSYADHANKHKRIIPERFSSLACSDSAIHQCGMILSTLSFANANFDIKGVVYEEVIRGTFDKSEHQQFFTPHQVVSFMVEMLRPYLKGVIADPACGTAGFLTEIVRSGAQYEQLIGLEIDERLAWVSGINLLLHGAKDFETHCLGDGGTLGPFASDYYGKIDAILTNPPFGSDFTDQASLQSFELGRGKSSRRRGVLFIERCWSLLRDGGVLGIVIDEGVLNLPSTVDVRRFILDRFDILSIVSLPSSAFMPYASVNASVLFLRKSKKRHRSQNVFFGKAEKIGRKSNGDDDVIYDDSGKPLPNSDLPEIIDRWKLVRSGKEIETDELGFVTNISENLAEDKTLRLDFRFHHPSRSLSKVLIGKSKYTLYTLADLCIERNETIIPSAEMEEQVILYTGLAHIESGNGVAHQVPTPAASIKSAVKRYEPGDILFARMRPNLRKVALMSFEEGGYTSPECVVLEVRKDANGEYLIDPKVLAVLLRSDLVFGQIMHLIAGIGRPRLNVKDLRKVKIPVPPPLVQQECKAEFEGRIASAKQLRSKAEALLTEAHELEISAVNDLANKVISG